MKEKITPEDLERRLKALNERLPDEVDFSERVMARIRVDAISPHGEKDYQLWRLVMKGVIGIAASVVVGIAAWHVFVGEPRVAYGLDDLPQRMLALKSLHVKGTIYGGAGAQPLELWLQRPNHARVNGKLGQSPDATDSTDEIIAPEGHTIIDAAKKSVVISKGSAVNAELDTEQCLQQMQMLMMPQDNGFKKVREETIAGAKADIYESSQTVPGGSFRVEVALNPASGLPLRSSMYLAQQSGKEVLALMFDVIEPNPVIAPETFVFHPPSDYQISHVESESSAGNMTSNAGNVNCGTKYVIAIDDKAILLCWARYDKNNPGNDLNFGKGDEGVDFVNGKREPYREHLLRADLAPEGFHWRWSLLTIGHQENQFARVLSFEVHSGRNKATSTLTPVVLPPEELAHLVEDAQRLTLPADQKGAEVMTLQEIKAAAAK